MYRSSIARLGFSTVAVAALLAGGCGSKASSAGGGGGGPSLKIVSPADGSSVSEPFTLKFDAGVPLGQPSTGDDHVHVCYDGASCDSGNYKIAYADSFKVSGLAPGKHTIEASLRHADHSAAGPTASITVTVTGGATASPTSGGGGKGYGY